MREQNGRGVLTYRHSRNLPIVMYLEGSVQLQAENGDGSSSGVFVVGLAFEDEAVEILGIGCPAAPYFIKD